jgi:ACS family hexuronate transporter-like MFS transporter
MKTRPVASPALSLVLRWSAAAFFALASTWNYLDRSVLSAAGPRIVAEFHLSHEQFGALAGAFGLPYALASPFVGWFLDRLGLETGIVCAVAMWSVAAALCGWTRSLGQLFAARRFLGVWESAGVPAAGKLNSIYLEPKDRALGAALTQVGIAMGIGGASVVVGWFADWRSPFLFCGLLGLGWIPLWMLVRRNVEPFQVVAPQKHSGSLRLLGDPRLIRLAAANGLWMVGYVMWTSWTTLYLKESFHLSEKAANSWALFPPFASIAGAFLGGWLSRRAIQRGSGDVRARLGALFVSALGCLVVALAPFCSTPVAATVVIAASYFWTTAGSVNLYTIPVDIWGGERAGTAISGLVCSYGLLQMVLLPGIGAVVDRFGYRPVCWMIALPPLLAWILLRPLGKSDR